jgi:serine/threonine protein kinase
MKSIQEKDAKTIILQILSGLRYLSTPVGGGSTSGSSSSSSSAAVVDGAAVGDNNDGEAVNNRMDVAAASLNGPRRRAIIHFDLKPGNILFDEMGDVKITGR